MSSPAPLLAAPSEADPAAINLRQTAASLKRNFGVDYPSPVWSSTSVSFELYKLLSLSHCERRTAWVNRQQHDVPASPAMINVQARALLSQHYSTACPIGFNPFIEGSKWNSSETRTRSQQVWRSLLVEEKLAFLEEDIATADVLRRGKNRSQVADRWYRFCLREIEKAWVVLAAYERSRFSDEDRKQLLEVALSNRKRKRDTSTPILITSSSASESDDDWIEFLYDSPDEISSLLDELDNKLN